MVIEFDKNYGLIQSKDSSFNESWIEKNTEAKKSIERGLEQAKNLEFSDDETLPGNHTEH